MIAHMDTRTALLARPLHLSVQPKFPLGSPQSSPYSHAQMDQQPYKVHTCQYSLPNQHHLNCEMLLAKTPLYLILVFAKHTKGSFRHAHVQNLLVQ